MTETPIKVLHFICSTGFYGAEKWILALANNSDPALVTSELVITKEKDSQDLQLIREFKALGLTSHEVDMGTRFDPRAIKSLVKLVKDQQIDILHSHGYKSDILGIVVAKMAAEPLNTSIMRYPCRANSTAICKDTKYPKKRLST